MTRRTYGQFCGIAQALELVGERWAMLIVRDLLAAPKRYSELQRGLQTIPTNILATRLRELEQGGVIERFRPQSSSPVIAYRLTAYGRELEDVLLRLGRWGAQSLQVLDDGPGYIDPAIRTLRFLFHPERSSDWICRINLEFGHFRVQVHVHQDWLEVGEGLQLSPDLSIDVRGSLLPVLARQISVDDALRERRIAFSGGRAALDRFMHVFEMEHPGGDNREDEQQ